jgi:hypothetical protein
MKLDPSVLRCLRRQAVPDEIGDAIGGGWIEIGQDNDRVARVADLEVAVHSRRAAAMTEAPNTIGAVLTETVTVPAASGRLRLTGCQQRGVIGVEELVPGDRGREAE